MYLVLGIAAAAAAAVLLYNHYSSARPDLADDTTTRAHQLAAVVLVLAKAIEGVLDALTYSHPRPRIASPRLVDWDAEDYT